MSTSHGELLDADDLLALPKVVPNVRLEYGTDSDQQFGHLYLPESEGSYPVVILIHGGCWRARVSLDYFGQAAQALTKQGITVWNLEYRRLGNGGGWRNTFLDVAAGADFLRDVAKDYPLDLNRAVAVGHSAGGHLVHWLAARSRLDSSSELYRDTPLLLKGFISLAGIPDLAEAVKRSICDDAAPVQLMGGLPSEVPERYVQGSPAELAPLACKQVFIQGRQDETVPHDYVESYVGKAAARGENVKLISLDTTGHFEVVIASTPQWKKVEAVIEEMLDLPQRNLV